MFGMKDFMYQPVERYRAIMALLFLFIFTDWLNKIDIWVVLRTFGINVHPHTVYVYFSQIVNIILQ